MRVSIGPYSLDVASDQLYALALGVAVLIAAGVWLHSALAAPADEPPPPAKAAPRAAPPRKAMASRAPVLREFAIAELAAFTGKDGGPILSAVDGIVFDLSAGRDFYGVGGGYHLFAGCDATEGLATMNLSPNTWDAARLSSSLTASQRDTLNSWVEKFLTKYTVVGCARDGAHPMTLDELNARLAQ